MLDILLKEIQRIEKECAETDYTEHDCVNLHRGTPETQEAYDEGFVDGMRCVRDYLRGTRSLPGNPQFELIDK